MKNLLQKLPTGILLTATLMSLSSSHAALNDPQFPTEHLTGAYFNHVNSSVPGKNLIANPTFNLCDKNVEKVIWPINHDADCAFGTNQDYNWSWKYKNSSSPSEVTGNNNSTEMASLYTAPGVQINPNQGTQVKGNKPPLNLEVPINVLNVSSFYLQYDYKVHSRKNATAYDVYLEFMDGSTQLIESIDASSVMGSFSRSKAVLNLPQKYSGTVNLVFETIGSTNKNDKLRIDNVFLSTNKVLGLGQNSPVSVTVENSIMVTEPSVMEAMVSTFDMGYMLGSISEWAAPMRKAGEEITVGGYAKLPFQRAANEQGKHAAEPVEKRLGDAPDPGFYHDSVMNAWNPILTQKYADQGLTFTDLDNVDDLEMLRDSPFRLLAIANLMDQAGDIDDRGNSDIAKGARSLGEVHYIYGLIDETYEQANGTPFPQTFVMAYVIPPLKATTSGWAVDTDLEHDTLMRSENQWKLQMEVWAELWADLSNEVLGSSSYNQKLQTILDLVTIPENFLALRSNTKINANEFELREWYTLQSTQFLNPRRPRNQLHDCLSGSQELTNIIEDYWKAEYGDLDVTTYTQLTTNGAQNKGKNGYDLFKNNDYYNAHFGTNLDTWSTCPQNRADMPFELATVRQNADGTDVTNILAPFARVNVTQGTPVYQLAPGTDEAKRHAFAIRNCNGCHGVEGATQGFHIAPRLSGQESALSPFLTGQGNNSFSHGGATYYYNQLQARKEWLEKVYIGQGELGDSLKRHERLNP